jgi:uncharacterized protein (UPF0332 family)
MTDKQTLLHYRLRQAEETLSDAQKMLEQNISPRSVINRAYYSMFYALLALYIASEANLKTSKHSGVIALFDKEFVHTGKIDPYFSKILHRLFAARQESDYKELIILSNEDAFDHLKLAEEFVSKIKNFILQKDH